MPKIGIIGGSGFYDFIKDARNEEINTEYGSPSEKIAIGKVNGVEVAFLPRHGSKHTIPPHKIPYLANIEALASLGVERIISTNAVGSLNAALRPGDFVFFDQFINATYGRKDTFFDGPNVVHVSTAEPYCNDMRSKAIESAKALGISFHSNGTVVVINGPRFSTKAESRLYSNYADTINMTQYPEIALAREKAMCYLGIGIVTDYDAGLEGRVPPVSYAEVSKTFSASIEKLKELIYNMLPKINAERTCSCKNALKNAAVTQG